MCTSGNKEAQAMGQRGVRIALSDKVELVLSNQISINNLDQWTF